MPAARSGSRWMLAAVLALAALGSSMPAASAATAGYVAMGDSFASGFGLMGVTPPCYQAPGSYPERTGSQLGGDTGRYPGLVLTDLACAKASIPAGITGPLVAAGSTVPAQLPAAEQAPHDLATLTVGANDVTWMQILKDCADPDYTYSCETRAIQPGTYEYDFDAKLAAFRTNLADVLTQINAWAVRPNLIITLYPWSFPESFSRTCMGTGMKINIREFNYLQTLLGRLNLAISDEAAAAGFATLDLRSLFTGHDLCSATPWSFPFHQPFSRAFHPNDAGHQAIANTVSAFWS